MSDFAVIVGGLAVAAGMAIHAYILSQTIIGIARKFVA